MSKPTILCIGDLVHTQKEWEAWSSKYDLKEFRNSKRPDFITRCKDGEYDDVVGLYRSNTSAAETGPFDQEIISILPRSLRYICHNGAGYDNIDVEACTQRGIQISSTPIAVDNATADVGIFLMLGALRYATEPISAVRRGDWRGKTQLGHDPNGKVLGILGMGGIGRVCISSNANTASDTFTGHGQTSTKLQHEDYVSQQITIANRSRRRCDLRVI